MCTPTAAQTVPPCTLQQHGCRRTCWLPAGGPWRSSTRSAIVPARDAAANFTGSAINCGSTRHRHRSAASGTSPESSPTAERSIRRQWGTRIPVRSRAPAASHDRPTLRSPGVVTCGTAPHRSACVFHYSLRGTDHRVSLRSYGSITPSRTLGNASFVPHAGHEYHASLRDNRGPRGFLPL